MSDPTVAHAQYFTEDAHARVLQVLIVLAAELDGTPLDADPLVLSSAATLNAQSWIAPGWVVLRISYAHFLEVAANPIGVVIQNFHLPDTTVLLALFPYPDGHTADEDAT